SCDTCRCHRSGSRPHSRPEPRLLVLTGRLPPGAALLFCVLGLASRRRASTSERPRLCRTEASFGCAMPDLPLTPIPPPLDPATGLRRIKLRPHENGAALTPVEDLFVIGHFGIPRLDPAHWSLTIDGLIESACAFSLDEIKARPKTVVEAVHQ